MNRTKLARRTALADRIRDRYNPPYRVRLGDGTSLAAATRAAARTLKPVGAYIEQRQDDGTYLRIR